jgi:hypothetical protein
MNQDKYFKELKRRVDILSSILAEPHPGFATWGIMLGESMRELERFWSDKDYIAEVDGRVGES